jgi:hypothetical protein
VQTFDRHLHIFFSNLRIKFQTAFKTFQVVLFLDKIFLTHIFFEKVRRKLIFLCQTKIHGDGEVLNDLWVIFLILFALTRVWNLTQLEHIDLLRQVIFVIVEFLFLFNDWILV